MWEWIQSLVWGSPAGIGAQHTIEFFNALSQGQTLSDSWWNATYASLTNVPQMVQDGFGYLIAGILYFAPPGGGFPQVFHDAFIYFGNAMNAWSFILPLSDMMYCLTFVIEVKLALWVFHFASNGINFIRGIPTTRNDDNHLFLVR